MIIEGDRGILVVLRATSDAALAVLVDKRVKIGVAMLAIRRCAEEIHNILH
jgi:predicted regulator of Ras-like GTPase activity (Roadblock/LC7/MglB family)